MNNMLVPWIVAAPMIVGATAALVNGRRGGRLFATILLCAGLLAEMLLIVLASGGMSFPALDLALSISPPAKLGLLAVNAALLCAVFYSWCFREQVSSGMFVWAIAVTSSLIGGAALAQDRIVAAICLLGAGVLVSAAALSSQSELRITDEEAISDRERTGIARRIAGSMKHLALASIGAVLFVAGALLLTRSGFQMENRGLLQTGVGLLAVGLMIRAGAMPFSSAANDLVDATPGVAIVMLGAVPGVLMAGLLMLSPVESSLVNPPSVVWLAAISVLLAGIRAISATRELRSTNDELQNTYSRATLITATVGLQIGWALFGVLSGSRTGVMGASLISANIGLAVPLMIMSSQVAGKGVWARVGAPVAVLSLLGLPPFGGFAGTLLVAQAAANISGLWLALLLLGSALVGIAWLRMERGGKDSDAKSPDAQNCLPMLILIAVLVCSQVALFAFSGRIVEAMALWGNVPWLGGP